MPDSDVVLAKVAAIQRYLTRIRNVTGLRPKALDDIDVVDIFVLNLQRAIQAAIDFATHIVASEGLGLADTIKGNFTLLQNANIINARLSKKMHAMVGFRNIAIHDYQAVDPDILKSILSRNLKDLEDFYVAIVTRFRLVKPPRKKN
jgi:uncharacterized protein YutE (UPF0331/DUF86 family)